ncbi:hypothetical protein CRYUN_Cryun08bG0119000 [Craigia yunnanensis]
MIRWKETWSSSSIPRWPLLPCSPPTTAACCSLTTTIAAALGLLFFVASCSARGHCLSKLAATGFVCLLVLLWCCPSAPCELLLFATRRCAQLSVLVVADCVLAGCRCSRIGIFAYLFSDNHSISLASLFLVLTLAENEDLEHFPASLVGISQSQDLTNNCESAIPTVDGGILVRLMP